MSAGTVAAKLIEPHLVSGTMTPGEEIGIRIDQTLAQDATGTMVMLAFAALDIPRVRTELSAQYVDHNLLQVDWRNADDHLFLRSACERFGVWYSKPGNGVSHPVHMQRLGIPGKSLLGADSHTCAGGSLGMLAIGAGGLEVAMAMAGRPFYLKMPRIFGVRLTGALPEWVSAKDVILEMLRRHGVAGGAGAIIEYYGPGLASMSAMDRHVIANMGAELGATTTVFPSDEEVRRFMAAERREGDWVDLRADAEEESLYDQHDEIDLGALEPLVALPSSPGNVVPVREVAGQEIYQAVVGSSANPGLRDFAIAAAIVEGRQSHDRVSFDVNPTSREILEQLAETGALADLVAAGARVHQAGCMGCVGMGQAPASGENSLRTVPRNFPGRSGVKDDRVFLASPETTAASALTGVITDPRDLGIPYPRLELPASSAPNTAMLVPPGQDGSGVELRVGPNIAPLPELTPLPDALEAPVLLAVGDDVSTDEIMPAGSSILALRSNIPEIAKHAFVYMDDTLYERAMAVRDTTGWIVVGGRNYGQGSSREHAALAPRYLGLRAVIAVSFARIHWQNLVNFGILPLTFADPVDRAAVEQGHVLALPNVRAEIEGGRTLTVEDRTSGRTFLAEHQLSPRQVRVVLIGGLLNAFRSDRA
ncbi:MAG TPA: aconitate hydratase [Actinomycetota bacterium]|nr:aconitate hydratase [Actinomycetota bacterium]